MISFVNKGSIDPVAITTFGVSAKLEGSIGFFGTGLKYAIAVVLRLGGNVTVWDGETPYEFGVAEQVVRGTAFDTVTMNGEPLGFTTRLGINWEPWQAYRELYCNARDEPGSRVEARRATPKTGNTTVHVWGCQPMEEAHANRGAIFLQSKLLYSSPNVEIHPGPSKHLYYQGVRVHELARESVCTYNLTGKEQLTEDRTLRYAFLAENTIRLGLICCEDEGVLEHLFRTATGESFEYRDVQLGASTLAPSTAFTKVAAKYARDAKYPLGRAVLQYIRQYDKGAALAQSVEPTKAEAEMMAYAVRVCRANGHPVDNYEIRLADSLGPGCLGMALRGMDLILISRSAFNKGPTCVVGTLLEEFIHLEYELNDETRALQDYLVDLSARLAERLYTLEES